MDRLPHIGFASRQSMAFNALVDMVIVLRCLSSRHGSHGRHNRVLCSKSIILSALCVLVSAYIVALCVRASARVSVFKVEVLKRLGLEHVLFSGHDNLGFAVVLSLPFKAPTRSIDHLALVVINPCPSTSPHVCVCV